MFSQNDSSDRDTSGSPRRRESSRESDRSWFYSEKLERFVAELREFQSGRRRQLLQLFVGIRRDFEKIHEIAEPIARVRVRRFRFAGFLDAIAEDAQGRLDLPLFSLAGDDAEHGENILERFEMVAAIAEDVDYADDAPILQFAQACADVGAGDAEGFRELIGGAGVFGGAQK